MAVIELHHILVKSPLLAGDILNELELGRDFADLALEFSCCPSKNSQGFAGRHEQGDLPEEIIHALIDHEGPESYSQTVKTEYGYHILKPTEVKPDHLITDEGIESED